MARPYKKLKDYKRNEDDSHFKHGIMNTGYRRINVMGKRRLLHRYLMEEFLGRKLKRNEFVHHKNGDKLDNRLENLEVININNHRKLHGDILANINKRLFFNRWSNQWEGRAVIT